MTKSVPAIKTISEALEKNLEGILSPELLSKIITTFNKRPYVFIMILYYMLAAKKIAGSKFMFFYMVFGYLIAFVAEYLSITSEVIPVFGTYY